MNQDLEQSVGENSSESIERNWKSGWQASPPKEATKWRMRAVAFTMCDIMTLFDLRGDRYQW